MLFRSSPKLEFLSLSKTSIFSFLQKLTFWATNLEIHLVEYVLVERTDHLVFGEMTV